MSVSELQTDIIKQLLAIQDVDTLSLSKEIFSKKMGDGVYKLSSFERSIVAESESDYAAGRLLEHETVVQRNKKWLEE